MISRKIFKETLLRFSDQAKMASNMGKKVLEIVFPSLKGKIVGKFTLCISTMFRTFQIVQIIFYSRKIIKSYGNDHFVWKEDRWLKVVGCFS